MMNKGLRISQAIDYLLGIVNSALTLTLCMFIVQPLHGCAIAQDGQPVGITLLFINKGSYSMGVHRFAQDGQTGPVPGALGVGGSAQMSFIPADSKRGVPQFVDIEWTIATPMITAMRESRDACHELYSNAWIAETKEINLATPMHKRRIALTSILTPELLAQVRANRKNTLLKLKVVFTDDDVTVTASAEVWRGWLF